MAGENPNGGRPRFHPGTLLKLYLWGYFARIRSSRRLEEACTCNLNATIETRIADYLNRLYQSARYVPGQKNHPLQKRQHQCREFIYNQLPPRGIGWKRQSPESRTRALWEKGGTRRTRLLHHERLKRTRRPVLQRTGTGWSRDPSGHLHLQLQACCQHHPNDRTHGAISPAAGSDRLIRGMGGPDFKITSSPGTIYTT